MEPSFPARRNSTSPRADGCTVLAISTTEEGCLTLHRKGIFTMLYNEENYNNHYVWRVLRNICDRLGDNDIMMIQQILYQKQAIIGYIKFPDRLIEKQENGTVPMTTNAKSQHLMKPMT